MSIAPVVRRAWSSATLARAWSIRCEQQTTTVVVVVVAPPRDPTVEVEVAAPPRDPRVEAAAAGDGSSWVLEDLLGGHRNST